MNQFFAFALAVILHPIADFVLQGHRIGYKKRGLNIEMWEHIFSHQALLLIPFLSYFKLSLSLVLAIIFYLSSHLLIDNLKILISERQKVKGPEDSRFWKLLGFDQMFHMIALFLIFWLL